MSRPTISRFSTPAEAALRYSVDDLARPESKVAGSLIRTGEALLLIEDGCDEFALLVWQNPINRQWEVTDECEASDFFRNGGERP